jgi:3-oxoacyl-[acyl-carrier protein] reductase
VTDDASRTAEFAKSVDRIFAVNVTSVATAVRAAAPLLPKGGRIISIGSVVGSSVAWPGLADYAATKSALHSYTKEAGRVTSVRQVSP